ncbi:YojF family protein [Piscibacillus salipiscarius]|uniref:YojF family protein n=1 Tax=Piscibacillus salipiscarius TaxID=299480 RepID=A0ABW5QBH1_9BACI|nr:YojF family protein [Piscibacillus salipiscarius]
MEAIKLEIVQDYINQFANQPVYVHLETTNGAYASHFNANAYNVGAYIRNARLTYSQGKIVEHEGSYRVGLKHEIGWIYAEGLTDFEFNENNQLLIAGHDKEGRLMVALQISPEPFSY